MPLNIVPNYYTKFKKQPVIVIKNEKNVIKTEKSGINNNNSINKNNNKTIKKS